MYLLRSAAGLGVMYLLRSNAGLEDDDERSNHRRVSISTRNTEAVELKVDSLGFIGLYWLDSHSDYCASRICPSPGPGGFLLWFSGWTDILYLRFVLQ